MSSIDQQKYRGNNEDESRGTSHVPSNSSRDVFRPRSTCNIPHEQHAGMRRTSSRQTSSMPHPNAHRQPSAGDARHEDYSKIQYKSNVPYTENVSYPQQHQSSYIPSTHYYAGGGVPALSRGGHASLSFDSHGNQVQSSRPAVTPYAYPPPPHAPAVAGYAYYPWMPLQPVEYIVNIEPEDVLSGRGGATNSHSGNRFFRSLVKKYQAQYLKAKKRDKPSVASLVVETIREKGGRFLRRVETTTSYGQVLWVDIGDDRAREKTCQALREGAPEIRRKKRKTASSFSTDEEDHLKRSDGERSPSSSVDRTECADEDLTNPSEGRNRKTSPTTRVESNDGAPDFTEDVGGTLQFPSEGPIMIRPSARLLFRRPVPEAIAVDQLSPYERDLYLRDFLPPDPAIRKKTGRNHVVKSSIVTPLGPSAGQEDTNPWQIVKV